MLEGGRGARRAYAHAVAENLSRARVRARIEAICADFLDGRSLRLQVLAILREVIDFDAYVWLLTDPVTAVGVAPLAEVPCLPELPALIGAKYATPVNRWTVLQLQSSPVGTLSDAVGGELSRSLMWRDVLCRYGTGDVASAVFADQFGCWGFLDLWRNTTRGPFSTAEAGLIATITAPLATALRRCQARTFVDPATPHRPDLGPVVLTLDDHLRIASRTAASRAWLDALLPPEPDQKAIPASVYNVAAQLLAVEKGVDAHPAFARTHLADGFWLALRAARLSPDRPPGHRQRHPINGTPDVSIGPHHPGPSQVDLCQDRRSRSGNRPLARPRHQTLRPSDEPGLRVAMLVAQESAP